MLSESEIRERDIAFYERRVNEDTLGASDRSQLAALYMDRARATGGFSDYERAERLARRSLALRTEHNSQTFGLLASALLARHDFAQALVVAKTADSLDPGVPRHLALLGEIELEIGDYAAANGHFASIHVDADQFTILARVVSTCACATFTCACASRGDSALKNNRHATSHDIVAVAAGRAGCPSSMSHAPWR